MCTATLVYICFSLRFCTKICTLYIIGTLQLMGFAPLLGSMLLPPKVIDY